MLQNKWLRNSLQMYNVCKFKILEKYFLSNSNGWMYFSKKLNIGQKPSCKIKIPYRNLRAQTQSALPHSVWTWNPKVSVPANLYNFSQVELSDHMVNQISEDQKYLPIECSYHQQIK